MTRRDLTPADGVDAAFALALTGLALVGWSTTIGGRTWWLMALGAAVAATLGVLGLVSSGYGTGATVALLTGGYVLVAGPVATGEAHLRGLAFLGDGAVGTADAWARLLGTHPPVAGTGAVLLAPLLLAMVAAGLGTSLALTTTRPGPPLVPALTALLVVLLTGPREPTSLLLQGGAFGVVAVAWLMLRGARRDPAVRGFDAGSRERVLVALVMVVVAAGLSVGAAGAADPDRVVLRTFVDGYDPSAIVTPLDEFRTYTEQRADFPGNVYRRQLLRVFGAPEGLRLRFAVLDQYDGTSWHASDPAHLDPDDPDDRYLRVSEEIDASTTGAPLSIAVRVADAWDRPWVPTAGDLTSFEFSFADDDRLQQLRYNPAADGAIMTDLLTPDDDYAFTAVLGDDTLDRSQQPGPDLDADAARWARFLDEPLAAWAGDTRRPVPALLRFADRLREAGRYTDGAEPWTARYRSGHSVGRLGKGFVLTVPTAGDDEQYAATVALAASRLGVPARVVVGAVVPPSNVVRGKDVSAWVEVQVADGSWRTLPTEEFMGSTPPPREPAPAVPPVRGFPQPPRPPDAPTPQPQPQPDPERADQDTRPDADHAGPTRWPWALLAVLLVGALPGVKLARRLRRLRAPPGQQQVRRRLARARGPRPGPRHRGALRDHPAGPGPGDGPGGGPRLAGRRRRLRGRGARARFGRGLLGPGLGGLRAMAAERPRWRRWWAPFNPASLRRP